MIKTKLITKGMETTKPKVIGRYRLLKDIPDLKAGAVFELIEWDSKKPYLGNPGSGALVLSWIDGMCQQKWCGGAYCLPGQVAKDLDWFENINSTSKEYLLMELSELKKKIDSLL